VGFRELSAGNSLGTMSQPQMRNLKFTNLGRLRVGGTLIVGGITYDQVSDSYNSLPGAERLPIGSKSSKTEKSSVYIVVRPTVVIFSPDAKKLNAELEAARRGGKPEESALQARRIAQSLVSNIPAPAIQAVPAPEVKGVNSTHITGVVGGEK
jgi:type II secretory pathway component GspD/PulD (secretin)